MAKLALWPNSLSAQTKKASGQQGADVARWKRPRGAELAKFRAARPTTERSCTISFT